MSPDDYVVLDFETTGFGGNSHVLQVAILCNDGKILIDELVKPPPSACETDKLIRMWGHAEDIHGISHYDVSGCRSFEEVEKDIAAILEGKIVVIYNKTFDMRYLSEETKAKASRFECAMNGWKQFAGKRVKLSVAANDCGFCFEEAKAHSAVYDCQATIAVWNVLANKLGS